HKGLDTVGCTLPHRETHRVGNGTHPVSYLSLHKRQAGQDANGTEHAVMKSLVAAGNRNGVGRTEPLADGNSTLKGGDHHLHACLEIAAVIGRWRQIAKYAPNTVQSQGINGRAKGF